MDAKGFVVPSGQGPVWNMAPGRSAALKMLSGETSKSVMMFEEIAPADTDTTMHLHHDSDEIAYVLSGKSLSRLAMRSQSAAPEHAHSCRAASRTLGRIPASNRGAFCSYTRQQTPEAFSKSPPR